MEIHRQQCQQCGSRDVRNILVRETDAPMTIYSRCRGLSQSAQVQLCETEGTGHVRCQRAPCHAA